MAVDQQTVRRIGKLARIKLEENEVPKLEAELNGILQWIEMLDEVDTSSVEPMTSAVETDMRLRKDEVSDGGYADAATGNAPVSEDHFFMVPKVVE